MAREFDEAVREVVDRIRHGYSERIRAGRRRAISVGPYRTATSTKRQYGLIVTPPPADQSDIRVWPGADRAAREFVRLVGVAEAQHSLAREARKRLG